MAKMYEFRGFSWFYWHSELFFLVLFRNLVFIPILVTLRFSMPGQEWQILEGASHHVLNKLLLVDLLPKKLIERERERAEGWVKTENYRK